MRTSAVRCGDIVFSTGFAGRGRSKSARFSLRRTFGVLLLPTLVAVALSLAVSARPSVQASPLLFAVTANPLCAPMAGNVEHTLVLQGVVAGEGRFANAGQIALRAHADPEWERVTAFGVEAGIGAERIENLHTGTVTASIGAIHLGGFVTAVGIGGMEAGIWTLNEGTVRAEARTTTAADDTGWSRVLHPEEAANPDVETGFRHGRTRTRCGRGVASATCIDGTDGAGRMLNTGSVTAAASSSLRTPAIDVVAAKTDGAGASPVRPRGPIVLITSRSESVGITLQPFGNDAFNNRGTVAAHARADAEGAGLSVGLGHAESNGRPMGVRRPVAGGVLHATASAAAVTARGTGGEIEHLAGTLTAAAESRARQQSLVLEVTDIRLRPAMGRANAIVAGVLSTATAFGVDRGNAGTVGPEDGGNPGPIWISSVVTVASTAEAVASGQQIDVRDVSVAIPRRVERRWVEMGRGEIDFRVIDASLRARTLGVGVGAGSGGHVDVARGGELNVRATAEARRWATPSVVVLAGDVRTAAGVSLVRDRTTAEAAALGVDGGLEGTVQEDATLHVFSSTLVAPGVRHIALDGSFTGADGRPAVDVATAARSRSEGLMTEQAGGVVLNAGSIDVLAVALVDVPQDRLEVDVKEGASFVAGSSDGTLLQSDRSFLRRAVAIALEEGPGEFIQAGALHVSGSLAAVPTPEPDLAGVRFRVGPEGLDFAVPAVGSVPTTEALASIGFAGGPGNDKIDVLGQLTAESNVEVLLLPLHVDVTGDLRMDRPALEVTLADVPTQAVAEATAMDGGGGNDTLSAFGSVRATAQARFVALDLLPLTVTGGGRSEGVSTLLHAPVRAVGLATGVGGGSGADVVKVHESVTASALSETITRAMAVNLDGGFDVSPPRAGRFAARLPGGRRGGPTGSGPGDGLARGR